MESDRKVCLCCPDPAAFRLKHDWFGFPQVQHPAAKMIVMASHMQEQEVGDGTNFVLVFAGALLELAEELLRMGLSVSEASKLGHCAPPPPPFLNIIQMITSVES